MWRGLQVTKTISLIILISFLALGTQNAHSFFGTSFWRNSAVPKLKYTTVAQSVFGGNCSGIVTVGTYNAAGTLTNVGADLTVTLTGPGTTTFYSNSNCSTAISSVTILNGTNTASFYFVETTVSSATIAAAGTGYRTANQTHTVSTNPYVWTGGASAGATQTYWSNAANWSGGVVPGAAHKALFDSTCVTNCSPTITANISIGGVRMTSGYSGTITLNNGAWIIAGSGGWSQEGGTFIQGNTNMSISGDFTLSGGTITLTSATLSIYGNFLVKNTPTFNAGTSTVLIATDTNITRTIIPGSLSFNSVTLRSYSSCYNADHNLTGTLTTVNLTIYCSDTYDYDINGGAINVSGNLTIDGIMTGTTPITLVGNGTVTGTKGGVGNFTINTPGGTYGLAGTIKVYRDYTYTAGTINAGTSILYFDNTSNRTQSITPGSVNYYNVQLGATGSCYNTHFNVVGTMKAQNLSTSCPNTTYNTYFDSGTIEVAGNFTSNFPLVGAGLVKMAGTGTITGGADSQFPALTIDTSGTITFAGTHYYSNNYTYVTGTVVMGSAILEFMGSGNTTITPGSITYENIVLGNSKDTCHAKVQTFSGTLKVNNLTLSCGTSNMATFVTTTVQIYKNFSIANTTNTTGLSLSLVGGDAATITQSATTATPDLAINKTAGVAVTFASNIRFMSTGQSLNVTSGNINMAGYNLDIKNTLNLNGTTLTKNGGVLTVNSVVSGSGAIHGGTVAL